MLVIRLMRIGKKNQPFFRFVVTEKKNPSTAGRTTEILGFYNPLTKERKINSERAKYWMSVGAKPSATVFNHLISEKIIEGKKIPKNKKSKKEPVVEKPAEVKLVIEQPAEKTEVPVTEAPVVEEKKEEAVVVETPAEVSVETTESAKPEEQPVSE